MKVTEVSVVKRTHSTLCECYLCGSMKDEANYLCIELADMKDAESGEAYICNTVIELCLNHGCALRFIHQLEAIKSQCQPSVDVSAVVTT